jgi:hypothetical protein
MMTGCAWWKMPTLEIIDLLVSLVITIVIAFVVYTANFTQAFTYRWVLLAGLLVLGFGKILSVQERSMLPSKMFFYWNIIFFVLMILAAYLVSTNHTDYGKYGSYLFIVLAVVDVVFAVYQYYTTSKLDLALLMPEQAAKMSAEKLAEDQAKMKQASMVSAVLVVIGDLLVLGGFAYAASQA